jgi:hypothetical protein
MIRQAIDLLMIGIVDPRDRPERQFKEVSDVAEPFLPLARLSQAQIEPGEGRRNHT